MNGLKIDFNLWSFQRYADVTGGPHPFAEFDAGYQVIIDKDDLTANLPAATYRAYIHARTDDLPAADQRLPHRSAVRRQGSAA